MSIHNDDVVMRFIKQESVEPVELDFDRRGASQDGCQRRQRRPHAPLDVAQRRLPFAAVDGLNSDNGVADSPLAAVLKQVEGKIARANISIQHWRAVSEKAGEKVEEERVKVIAFVCLVKVIAEQHKKRVGEFVAAQTSLPRVEEQKKKTLFEVAVIQEILARHHASIHGLGATLYGLGAIQPGQLVPRHPECALMDKFRALQNLVVEAKNKTILLKAAPSVRQSRVKAEEEQHMAKKHLAGMVRFKEDQIERANTVRNSMCATDAHYTTTFVRVHL
ncbi:hypothetical protein JCM10296v2_004338 [Rhodotorula toruloides]